MTRTNTKTIVNRIQADIVRLYRGPAEGFPDICADIVQNVKERTRYRTNCNIYEYVEMWILNGYALFEFVPGNAEALLSAWIGEAEVNKHTRAEVLESVLHLLAREIIKGATKK